MASYLITGSARGLGLELATQISQLPEVDIVFATSRKSSAGIDELVKNSNGKVVFVQLDTTDESSINKAVEVVSKRQGNKGLDVLVNSAGICIYPIAKIYDM